MYPRLIYFLSFILLSSCSQQVPNQQRQLGLDWQFSGRGDDTWYPARVPGSVQEDLQRNGLLPDPFFGTNEDSIQWVSDSSWRYKTILEITPELMKYNHLDLVFNGLDTYARVFINDSLILSSENMFVDYHFDIRRLVRAGKNDLRVEFESPIEHNREFVESMPFALPSSENAERKVSPYTRKAAYQFGWDFAPRIVTMGIWRPIALEAWNDLRITKVFYKPQYISDSLAVYEVNIELESTDEGSYDLLINSQPFKTEVAKGINQISREIRLENPKLWWPNGLGEPHLYDFTVSIYNENRLIDADTTSIGIRNIKLIQEQDSIGTSFRFEVNGKPVYAKGANWSPLSSYPGSIADSVYRNRLKQVKEAHMNMLRVWGGGIYESDLFYELCDQNGILVWQDFMFANTMYPPSQEFLANVENEVEYQLERLYNHPSIALWNGNNEIEVAWKNWGWQDQYGYSEQDSTDLWEFYLKIFDELIPEIINELDPSLNYCSTSPLSNWGKLENFNHGSMHYWGVWHGQDGFEDYRKYVGRFVSEYGFQSFPSISTTRTYTALNSINPEDDRLLHQKSYVGTRKITAESEKYFGQATDLQEFIYHSQLTQAYAYKIAIESHRLTKHCAGTLFWQLNDCWPGPSWSVIDVNGQQKLAYEVIKDRYQQYIVVPQLSEDDLRVTVLNDGETEQFACLTIELVKSSGERIWQQSKEFTLPSNNSTIVYKSHRNKILDGFLGNEVSLKLTLSVAGEVKDIEYLYFTAPKDYLGTVDLVGLD